MITEKGAIVMIVCSVLTLGSIYAQLQRICVMTSASTAFAVLIIITFPTVRIVADTCIGRFKAIQASIVFLMDSTLSNMMMMINTAKTMAALVVT